MSSLDDRVPDGNVVPTSGPRIILVDTNCFLRLYHSPLRPFLGEVIGGYKLLTLAALVSEFLRSPRLQELYAWVIVDVKAEDITKAALQPTAAEAQSIASERAGHKDYVQSVIETYCQNKAIPIRSVSGCDLDLLATAIVFESIIATDEWPLRLVVDDLMSVAGEYNIATFTSLDLLNLFEKSGKLTPDERRSTIKSWLRYDEKLPREWRADYQKYFGELPPRLG